MMLNKHHQLKPHTTVHSTQQLKPDASSISSEERDLSKRTKVKENIFSIIKKPLDKQALIDVQ